MEKQYFIYMTTNLINKKKYIGYHYGYENDSYLGSGSTFLKAVKKYGKENFSRIILEFCPDKETTFEREKYWIKYYNAVEDDSFYNFSEGGELHSGWSEYRAWRERNPEQARQHDLKASERLKQWIKEHPEIQEENKKRLLQTSTQWREAHQKEVQMIMEKVNLAKEKWQQDHPEEHQAEIDKWRQAGSIANSQKIRCITTGEEFESISAAARAYAEYGCYQANISKALSGQRKSCGKKDGKKLIWELINPS